MERQAIIVAIVAFILGAATVAMGMRVKPESIKECMLDQMRGQAEHMHGIAKSICEERHPTLVGKEDYY